MASSSLLKDLERRVYRLWLRYLIEHDAYVIPSAEALADVMLGTGDHHAFKTRPRNYMFQRKAVKRQITKKRIGELDGNYAGFRRDALVHLGYLDAAEGAAQADGEL